MALDYLRALWPVGLAIAGLIVWIVRLEARVRRIEERFAEICAANSGDHKAIKSLLYELRDVFVRKGWIGPKDIEPNGDRHSGGA